MPRVQAAGNSDAAGDCALLMQSHGLQSSREGRVRRQGGCAHYGMGPSQLQFVWCCVDRHASGVMCMCNSPEGGCSKFVTCTV